MNAKIETSPAIINGLDVERLGQAVEEIAADSTRGQLHFALRTSWDGGFRMVSRIDGCSLGGEALSRPFTIVSDEPSALMGGDSAPNPQELLMASLASCIGVSLVAGASQLGISIEKLEIESRGRLDLRGAFAIDPAVIPGYEELEIVVRVAGDATPEQFEELLQSALQASPNHWNLSQPVRISASLEVQ
jgi:uncharacterized OsmC-like protein